MISVTPREKQLKNLIVLSQNKTENPYTLGQYQETKKRYKHTVKTINKNGKQITLLVTLKITMRQC